MMKAFVINLDRNPERLAFMQEQFQRLGMDVERFPTENQESPKAPWFLRLPLRGLDWALWKLTGR